MFAQLWHIYLWLMQLSLFLYKKLGTSVTCINIAWNENCYLNNSDEYYYRISKCVNV